MTFDNVAPTVTINRATGQARARQRRPIRLTVTFSEPVTGFIAGDVSLLWTGQPGAQPSPAPASSCRTGGVRHGWIRPGDRRHPGGRRNGCRRQLDALTAHFPDYPTKESPRGGKVYVDVAGATPDAIYNTPNTLMPVFPGEEIELHSPPEVFELAANTWRNQRNEGGNELVFLNLQGARLGLLDLEKFKRELRYCQMPNGTFTDMNLQAGGRVLDSAEYDFMRLMGIWIENFAVPVVINECLLQATRVKSVCSQLDPDEWKCSVPDAPRRGGIPGERGVSGRQSPVGKHHFRGWPAFAHH